MTTVTIDEAQHDLPKLVARVEQGETIVLERDGKAVGQLGPVSTAELPEGTKDASFRLGMLEGQARIPENWKELGRQEIEEEFYGKA